MVIEVETRQPTILRAKTSMMKATYANNVMLGFSQPWKPTDNGFIEAFNCKFRAECLLLDRSFKKTGLAHQP